MKFGIEKIAQMKSSRDKKEKNDIILKNTFSNPELILWVYGVI